MDELNQHESDNLTALITLILEQAKWLARALIVSGLLCMASLVPVLSGPLLSILLTVMVWYEVGNVVVICILSVLAYYYVLGCTNRNLDRFIEQNKKKAGK